MASLMRSESAGSDHAALPMSVSKLSLDGKSPGAMRKSGSFRGSCEDSMATGEGTTRAPGKIKSDVLNKLSSLLRKPRPRDGELGESESESKASLRHSQASSDDALQLFSSKTSLKRSTSKVALGEADASSAVSYRRIPASSDQNMTEQTGGSEVGGASLTRVFHSQPRLDGNNHNDDEMQAKRFEWPAPAEPISSWSAHSIDAVTDDVLTDGVGGVGQKSPAKPKTRMGSARTGLRNFFSRTRATSNPPVVNAAADCPNNSNQEQTEAVQNAPSPVPSSTLIQWLNEMDTSALMLVDLRREGFEEGHLRGALNLNIKDFFLKRLLRKNTTGVGELESFITTPEGLEQWQRRGHVQKIILIDSVLPINNNQWSELQSTPAGIVANALISDMNVSKCPTPELYWLCGGYSAFLQNPSSSLYTAVTSSDTGVNQPEEQQQQDKEPDQMPSPVQIPALNMRRNKFRQSVISTGAQSPRSTRAPPSLNMNRVSMAFSINTSIASPSLSHRSNTQEDAEISGGNENVPAPVAYPDCSPILPWLLLGADIANTSSVLGATSEGEVELMSPTRRARENSIMTPVLPALKTRLNLRRTAEGLRKVNAGFIVNVARESIDLGPYFRNHPDVSLRGYRKFDVDDYVDEEIEDTVLEAIQTIERFHAEDPAAVVYVHCMMGRSRSATVVAAYLMHTLRWNLARTLQYMTERRPVVCPNIGFISVLKGLEKKWNLDGIISGNDDGNQQ